MKTVTLANVTSPKIIDKDTIAGSLEGYQIQIRRRAKDWKVVLEISINGRLWESDAEATPTLIRQWDKLADKAYFAQEAENDAARALINDSKVNDALFSQD